MATLTANVLSSTLTKYHTDFLGMLRLSRHWMQVQPTATLFVSYTTYQSRYTRKHTVYPLAHDPKQRPQHNTPTPSANLGLTGNLLVFILPLSKHHSHTSVEFSTTSPAHVSPANLIQTPAALLIKVPPISGLRSDDLSKEVITTYDIQPMGEHRGHQIVTFYETDLHATQLNPDLPLTQCAATLPLDLLAQIAPSSRGQREEVGKRSHSLSSTSTHSSDSAGNTSEEEDDPLAIDLFWAPLALGRIKPALGLIRLSGDHIKSYGLQKSGKASIRNWYRGPISRSRPNLDNLLMIKDGIPRAALQLRVDEENPWHTHSSTGPFVLTTADVNYNWDWDPQDPVTAFHQAEVKAPTRPDRRRDPDVYMAHLYIGHPTLTAEEDALPKGERSHLPLPHHLEKTSILPLLMTDDHQLFTLDRITHAVVLSSSGTDPRAKFAYGGETRNKSK